MLVMIFKGVDFRHLGMLEWKGNSFLHKCYVAITPVVTFPEKQQEHRNLGLDFIFKGGQFMAVEGRRSRKWMALGERLLIVRSRQAGKALKVQKKLGNDEN